MRDLLIVGVDPGTTLAYAILDLDRNLIKLKSSKQLSLSSLTTEVTNEGKVLIVGCDVSNIPSFVYKFATKLNAVIVKPDFDFKVGLKQRMTKEFKVRDDHQRDALAAALNAFSEFKETFKKIDDELKNIGKEHLNSQVKEICIKNKLNVIDAINLLETTEEKPKEKKRKNRFLNDNGTNELIRILKKQNDDLLKNLKFLELKYKDLSSLIDKRVEERIKKLNAISGLNIKSFTNDISRKEAEIIGLKQKIAELNSLLLDLNNKVIVKKFQNLNFNENFSSLIYVENPNVYTEQCLNFCQGKIIIYKERPSNHLIKKNIVFINKEDCFIDEIGNLAIIDKSKLESSINSLTLVQNLIESYREERQKEASEKLLKP